MELDRGKLEWWWNRLAGIGGFVVFILICMDGYATFDSAVLTTGQYSGLLKAVHVWSYFVYVVGIPCIDAAPTLYVLEKCARTT